MNYLAITHTYETIEIILFSGNHSPTTVVLPKKESSRMLATRLKELISDHSISLSDLDFIAVNQGPGPFTTLRVIIATVNGISFASGIPLVGVDGLDALLHESSDIPKPVIALLNAFSNDVYFGITAEKNKYHKGYKNIEVLLKQIANYDTKKTINFIGNGSELFKDKIEEIIGDQAHFPKAPSHCSVKAIGALGLKNWNTKKNIFTQIKPLYLKRP